MTASHQAEKLVEDIKTVVRDAEKLLRASGTELNETVRNRLEETVEAAKDCCERTERQVRLAAKRTDATVREHPYEAIGISLAVGVLFGILLGRR